MNNPNEVRIDPSVPLGDSCRAAALAERQLACRRLMGAKALAPWHPLEGRVMLRVRARDEQPAPRLRVVKG